MTSKTSSQQCSYKKVINVKHVFATTTTLITHWYIITEQYKTMIIINHYPILQAWYAFLKARRNVLLFIIMTTIENDPFKSWHVYRPSGQWHYHGLRYYYYYIILVRGHNLFCFDKICINTNIINSNIGC